MLLLIDNYDSFTFNLAQRFGEIDPRIDVRVVRNDEHTIDELVEMNPDRVVVSISRRPLVVGLPHWRLVA